MKKITLKLLLLAMFFSPAFLLAQNKQAKQPSNVEQPSRCYTDEATEMLRQKNPDMMSREEFHEQLKPYINAAKAQLKSNQSKVVVTIPVVVHVFHNGEAVGVDANISDDQVLSQIQVLNEDYRRMLGTRGYNTNPVGADLELEFCMAQTDPNGAPTNGIDRVNIGQDGLTGAGTTDSQIQNSLVNQTDNLKLTSFWDNSLYLNMYTVKFNNGMLLGYAYPPNSGVGNADGVVSRAQSFGSNDAAGVNIPGQYNLGRTMTHEVGHYFALDHTFNGGCAGTGSAGDFCADTPAIAQPNYGCPTGIDSCTSDAGNDMIENYMDYTDDACMDTFTLDQKTIVLAALSGTNRASLTSSSACNPSSPTINIGSTSPGSINEGSDCLFTDFIIDMSLSMPASASASVNLVNSGTATEGTDFMLMNNSVTFGAGATNPSNAITLRVNNDSFVEGDETIELAVNISTSGDAIASTTTYNVTILDDDVAVASTAIITHYVDNFDDEDLSDWAFTDADTDTYNWGDQTTVATGTSPGLVSRSWLSGGIGALTPDNWAVSPAFDLTTATGTILLDWTTLVAAFSWDEEKYSVHVGTSNNIATLVNSATTLTETLGDVGNTGTVESHSLDISAFAGQPNVYIAFRHWDCSNQDFILVDDVTVISISAVNVQTAINTATAANNNLNGTGVAFFTDTTSEDIMLDIDNTGGFDYGCTTASVSRDVATAGADAVAYNGGTDPSGYVTAKTFDITTANASTGDASTINFYFTEAEIAGWEATTGNNRSALNVKKEGTDEVVAVTISSFGTNLKASAPFTTGLAGTYVFGSQLAFLSTIDFELNTGLSIYPNPSSDVLNISLSDNDNLPDNYKIYNMLGQIITDVKINNTSDLVIKTSSFSNGMYFIKIVNGDKAVTFRFIKK